MSVFPVFLNADRSAGFRSAQPSNHRLILGVTPEGTLTVVGPTNTNRSWNPPAVPRNRSINITGRDDFEINLDIHHFAPEDISVKVVDKFLIIEAGHEEKQDEYGWVKRQFSRRYALPEGCDFDAIESRLSSDGVLTVIAPHRVPRIERTVPIIQTGPVRSRCEDKTEAGDGESPETIATTLQ